MEIDGVYGALAAAVLGLCIEEFRLRSRIAVLEKHYLDAREKESEYRQRCDKMERRIASLAETVRDHGFTFLADDFRRCFKPSDAMPICPNHFPERTIYLQEGPGVGEMAPQELKERYERDQAKKTRNLFATYYKCPVCPFELRLVNEDLEGIQLRIFRKWSKPLGK